jgi:hypothetical protein
VSLVIAQHQATQASEASAAMTAMLAEQGITALPQARIDPLSLTTTSTSAAAMLEQIDSDLAFDRLVRSLVQDAGRTAQLISATTRRGVSHVRHLNPPSCSRCAVLAGRVYTVSTGFLRHPQCDCVMIPVTVASPDLTYDPTALAKQGLVRGLSKADMRALDDGADFARVVNVRLKKAGANQVGEVYWRGGRHMTPAGIYRKAQSRDEALTLLQQFGYIR